MNILSLFDGMACGMLAMLGQGIEVERYVAYEIDKYAIKTSTHNFPMIEHRGDVFGADFTEFKGFDYVVGGSPCTYWSIAQKNNRETEASGMGWELFSQYVRAIKEAEPKYFIYENNKSMSNAIRESITNTFGFEPIMINSALLSAQNRQRLYWVGKRNADGTYSKVDVQMPEDKGILLRDILEYGVVDKEKAYCLKHQAGNARDYFKKHHTQIAYEPVCVAQRGRYTDTGNRSVKGDGPIEQFYEARDDGKTNALTTVQKDNYVAEPVRIPEYGQEDKARPLNAYYSNNCGGFEHRMFNENPNKQQTDMIAEPVQGKGTIHVGAYPRPSGELSKSQAFQIYSVNGKSTTQMACGGGAGGKTGLYAVPVNTTDDGKSQTIKAQYQKTSVSNICLYTSTYGASGVAEPVPCYAVAIEWDEDGKPIKAISGADGKEYTVYEVKDGIITIKGKQYPIKLEDGFYIIRKLTVRECMRLQTVPEWYEFPVSDTQAYKMLGNGWTVEVIMWLIGFTLE